MKALSKYIRLIFNLAFNDKRLGFVYGVIFVCVTAPLLGVMNAKAALIFEFVIFFGILLATVIWLEYSHVVFLWRNRGFTTAEINLLKDEALEKHVTLSLPDEWVEVNIHNVPPKTAAENIARLLRGQVAQCRID